MARELKVFAMTLATYGDESERLGQARHVRQMQAVVATTTKKEAIEKFGITPSEANGYMHETGNEQDIAKAMSKPGQVFAHAINSYGNDRPYIEITRTPHVPLKRAKRLSYEERKALWDEADRQRELRQFTHEELEYMVDMFAGANNPVAASIAERARLRLGDLNRPLADDLDD
jgi:hypothetical protein